MNIRNSKTYNSDLLKCVNQCTFIDFNALKNKSFFVTGCTGLIGSAFVDFLLMSDSIYNLELKVYAAGRDVEKIRQLFINTNESTLIPVKYDAIEPLDFSEHVNFIIHAASNASPDLFNKFPVDTMKSNLWGLDQLLSFGKKNNSRILYVSSSEVYGKLDSVYPIKENQSGYIDILDPHSSYCESKRASETLCVSYFKQYGSDVVIARPGHIFGPTASRNDIRVSSDFMYKAADDSPIILKSNGLQKRSYTYCLDCATALLFILLKGESGQSYNISNSESIITIAEMAEYFAKAGNQVIKFEIPDTAEKQIFNPMMNSSLDSSKLEGLGWKAIFKKEQGFEHSVNTIKESRT